MIELKVNHKEYQLEVVNEKPILWVLREDLGLTGTKYGCGRGLCGACTVHLGSQAIRSCITPIRNAHKESILTIEGLKYLEEPNPSEVLLSSWKKNQVPQCGYCQPGQIMQALNFVTKHRPISKKDTIDKIKANMQGNLCRCGTYQRIQQAILETVEKLNDADA